MNEWGVNILMGIDMDREGKREREKERTDGIDAYYVGYSNRKE